MVDKREHEKPQRMKWSELNYEVQEDSIGDNSYPIPKKSKLSLHQAVNVNVETGQLQYMQEEQKNDAATRDPSPTAQGYESTSNNNFVAVQPCTPVEQARIVQLSIKTIQLYQDNADDENQEKKDRPVVSSLEFRK